MIDRIISFACHTIRMLLLYCILLYIWDYFILFTLSTRQMILKCGKCRKLECSKLLISNFASFFLFLFSSFFPLSYKFCDTYFIILQNLMRCLLMMAIFINDLYNNISLHLQSVHNRNWWKDDWNYIRYQILNVSNIVFRYYLQGEKIITRIPSDSQYWMFSCIISKLCFFTWYREFTYYICYWNRWAKSYSYNWVFIVLEIFWILLY